MGSGYRLNIMRRPIVPRALGLVLALSACSSSFPDPDPVFESTTVTDVVQFGGDCAERRCVTVTAMVRGSSEGQGSCALYGPGDPDTLDPLAENDSIEMVPDKEAVWTVELPEGSPDTSELNPVCEPMMEG